MKISFDFDDTLDQPLMQSLAKILNDGGAEVFIVSARCVSVENVEVLKIANKIGVPIRNIHFTENQLKQPTIEKLGIDLHIDDNWKEIELIRQKGGKGFVFDLNVFEFANEIREPDDITKRLLI